MQQTGEFNLQSIDNDTHQKFTKRVLGYVMARNEWPLLGLAITHGFQIGLEHIIVVDHASTDETAQGLQNIQSQWQDRLTVIRLDMDKYLQATTASVVLSCHGADTYDWVYVFDADEFALTGKSQTLPELLATIPDDVGSVRYELQQWLSPLDMDERNLSHYARITERSIPTVFLDQPGELLAQQLQAGFINFFDLHFPSKVIVRGRYATRLFTGAHRLDNLPDVIEQELPTSAFRVAHLTLLSRDRLERKAAHGKQHIEANDPPGHGWQNQTIYRLQQANKLDAFWQAHSIAVEPNRPTMERGASDVGGQAQVFDAVTDAQLLTPSEPTTQMDAQWVKPQVVTDTDISNALQTAVTILSQALRTGGVLAPNTLAATAKTSRSLGAPTTNYKDAKNTNMPQWQQTGYLEQFISHIDDLKAIHAEQQLALKEVLVQSAKENRKNLEDQLRERDKTIEELSATIQALLSSTCWRITAPVRSIVTSTVWIKHVLTGLNSPNDSDGSKR